MRFVAHVERQCAAVCDGFLGDVGSVDGLIVVLDVLHVDIFGAVFRCVDGEGFVVGKKECCTFEKGAAEDVGGVTWAEGIEAKGIEDVPGRHFAIVFVACETVGFR